MRVIIAGGTGFLGVRLAAELASAGYEVVALSRHPERTGGLPPGLRVVRWDAATALGWGHLADGATAIINLAGENLAGTGLVPSRWTATRKARIRESRINAGRAIVDAVGAAAVKPKVVIQSSGIGHYGPHDTRIMTESDPPGDDFLARVTLDWEGSTAGVTRYGVRHVCTRSAVVLSPSDGALLRMLIPFRLFVGGPLGSGRQPFPWIHPADEISAVRFLLENDAAAGPFNLIAPQPITLNEFGAITGRVLRRPYWFPIPAFVLRGVLGEIASTVLEGQRAMPVRLLEMGFKFRFPTAEVALRDLLR